MNIFSEIFVSHVCCILQFTPFVLNLSGWTFSIQISRSHFNFEAWHSYDDNPSSQIKGMFWGKCKQTADIFSFHEFFGLEYFFPFSYKKGTVESPWASVPLGFQPLGGPFGFQVMVQNQSILFFFALQSKTYIFIPKIFCSGLQKWKISAMSNILWLFFGASLLEKRYIKCVECLLGKHCGFCICTFFWNLLKTMRCF